MTPIRAWSEDNVSLTALRDRLYQPSNGIDVPDRWQYLGTSAQVNGTGRVVLFTPSRTLTVSNFTAVCTGGATDTGGTTVRKFGLYTVNTSAQTLTAIARSANDVNMGSTGSTSSPVLITKAFTSESGYSSSVTLTAGTTYGVGWIFYNTGGTFAGPTMVVAGSPFAGAASGIMSNQNLLPNFWVSLSSQTDITNSAATYGFGGGSGAYVRLT